MHPFYFSFSGSDSPWGATMTPGILLGTITCLCYLIVCTLSPSCRFWEWSLEETYDNIYISGLKHLQSSSNLVFPSSPPPNNNRIHYPSHPSPAKKNPQQTWGYLPRTYNSVPSILGYQQCTNYTFFINKLLSVSLEGEGKWQVS